MCQSVLELWERKARGAFNTETSPFPFRSDAPQLCTFRGVRFGWTVLVELCSIMDHMMLGMGNAEDLRISSFLNDALKVVFV